MTSRGHFGRLAICTAATILGACSQVDVYAVTSSLSDAGLDDSPSAAGSTPTIAAPAPGTATAPDAATLGDDDPTSPSEAPTTTSEGDMGEEPSPVTNCPSPVVPAGDTTVTLRVGTTSRSYLLHVPTSYDGTEPVPLIVDFHGMGTSADTQRSDSTYPAVTDPEGVIMAFPEGTEGPLGAAWNMGPCCVAEVDDLAFARALVADVQTTACIDPDRVYAVGVLTGGGMVYHLACEAADLFAAIAPSSFDLLAETAAACDPSRPISVISFRGTADVRVPYSGGPSSLVPGMPITFLGAEGTLERWGEINGCSGPQLEEDENGCAFQTGCSNDVDVALCTERGGREGQGRADVAWPVLKRHTR